MAETLSEEFWNDRYRRAATPWDYGGVPPEFTEYLERNSALKRILIPGCGSGYEVHAALEAGHQVFGIDLSSEAVKRVQARLGAAANQVVQGNFFSHPYPDHSFDAVYERTFLCAIHPDLRPEYVRRMHALLKRDGILFGFFLYGEEPDPPPYPLQPGAEKALFGPFFEQQESKPSREPLPFFEGMERWQVWRKRN